MEHEYPAGWHRANAVAWGALPSAQERCKTRAANFPWTEEQRLAVEGWLRALRWTGPNEGREGEQKGPGVTWAELVIDYELYTGEEVPDFHRPRWGAKKEEGPLSLGDKAKVLAHMVRALQHYDGKERTPPTQDSRVRTLTCFGFPAIAGFRHARPRALDLCDRSIGRGAMAGLPGKACDGSCSHFLGCRNHWSRICAT